MDEKNRENFRIWEVGYEEPEIRGNKLPSKRQVIQCVYYYIRRNRMSTREACNKVVKKCEMFWAYAKIPTKKDCDSSAKLEKFIKQYNKLYKNSNRAKTVRRLHVEAEFRSELDNLFDIAHQVLSTSIKDEVTKEFLRSQRMKGRQGEFEEILDSGCEKFQK